MAPTLTDYTWCFGDAGTILNSDSLGLPFIDVDTVTGLDSAPLRTTTDEHQGMDGTYIDTPYMSSRTVVISGTLYTNPSDPDTLLTSLKRDYQSNVVRPLYFKTPNQVQKFVNGQGGGLKYDIDGGRRSGITTVQFTVLCGDPYIYDYPPQVVNTGPPAVPIGTLSFNLSFNVGFGGGAVPAQATLVNNGTLTAYPIITLTGPLTNPVLSDGNGTTMSLAITLNSGDILVVDCRNKSIVLNGVQSRRGAMSGLKWISVPAGTDDTIFLNAASGTGTAQLRMSSTYY